MVIWNSAWCPYDSPPSLFGGIQQSIECVASEQISRLCTKRRGELVAGQSHRGSRTPTDSSRASMTRDRGQSPSFSICSRIAAMDFTAETGTSVLWWTRTFGHAGVAAEDYCASQPPSIFQAAPRMEFA